MKKGLKDITSKNTILFTVYVHNSYVTKFREITLKQVH